MAAPRTSVSELLERTPSATRPTLDALRRAIRGAEPDATEVAYQSSQPRSKSAMWKVARYLVDDRPVVGIGTFTNHAAVFFYRGRELDDGSGLLSGTGRDTRFIRLESPTDVEAPALAALLRKAFGLGGRAA